jgi:hypothetical protein
MKSILDQKTQKDIIERIKKINPESKALWGKMNTNEMLCHTADQIRMATGEIKTKYRDNFMSRSLLKWLIFAGMPAPKGKVETAMEIKQGAGGTHPVNFDQDKKTLIKLVEDFNNKYPADQNTVHPAFGPLTKQQWGKLTYTHLVHHLRQFGV